MCAHFIAMARWVPACHYPGQRCVCVCVHVPMQGCTQDKRFTPWVRDYPWTSKLATASVYCQRGSHISGMWHLQSTLQCLKQANLWMRMGLGMPQPKNLDNCRGRLRRASSSLPAGGQQDWQLKTIRQANWATCSINDHPSGAHRIHTSAYCRHR